MYEDKKRPACIECRYSAKYAPLCGEKEPILRCVRYAPHPKLSNINDFEIYDKLLPNYPVVADRMFCGEFEAK